jgi:curved DNA-binding protein CbpA
MADKTLYDLLEVSDKASMEVIRAAYERLSNGWDAESVLQPGNAEAALRYTALKEAFLTLADPLKRAAYDCRLLAQRHAPVATPVCTFGNMLLLAVLLVTIGGGYYSYNRSKRLAKEQAVAEAKAKEAEEETQAAAERVQLQQAQNRAKLLDAGERQRREADLRRFQYEQSARERENRNTMDRERYARQQSDAQRMREEMLAANSARQQVAREKAELCRLERARYGHSISC